MVNIKQDFIKISAQHRPGIKMKPTSITIHSTGNPSSRASGERKWLDNPSNNRSASWHFVVDDSQIIQAIPTNEVAWHAGTRAGNYSSIGIEICESGNRQKALQNAIDLTVHLMKSLGITRVVRHYDWSRKICPRIMYDNGSWSTWKWFYGEVMKKYNGQSSIQYVEKNTLPVRLGHKGELVKKIQVRLNTKPVDGYFGVKTEQDVKTWQSLHDENGNVVPKGKGLVVDGIVGEKTYYALFPGEKKQQQPQPKEPAYDVTVDGKNVVTSAYDKYVLEAVAKAIENNKAQEVVIKRIDY